MRAVRHALFLGSVLSLAACGGGEVDRTVEADATGRTQAPLHPAEPGRAIADSYIVKVRDGADARAVAAVAGVSPKHVYSVINGFAATLTPGQLTALRHQADVEYLEQDQVFQANACQSTTHCNLDRIDQRALPLDGTYCCNSTGAGVNVYIIDSGLQTTHPEFGGRAANVYDATGGTGADCNGHGTHVAGIVGSVSYGVAKGVKLRGVRVLDCAGSGATSGVIAGIDWVRVNHLKPAVANVSVGGPFSSTLNTAVTNLANAGVFTVAGAGNSGADACNYSPASAPAITTVGATTCTDSRIASSNYGSCVDLYAPGSSVTSTWLSSGTNTLSGTSMAAPHVAGVGALYKATYGDASQATVDSWLKTNATSLSFGKLLYKSSL
ncbi:S8 family peptidase [Archangium sp.]|uniref:S8 family peptidase n=1 Tax=Archangium sp. TaxID=1872627 RepID=UPI002D2D1352|nr:S8 family peptidase [Archangium sp.]HYO55200.1 S8 family peptidase [Archangium sp.]